MILTSHAEFLASPIGRCTVGRTFAVWCQAPDLTGTILWGEPDEADIRDMVAVFDYVQHPDVSAERRALVDGRDLGRVDGDTLLAFTELARPRISTWSPRTGRHAIVVPRGLSGLLVAGSFTSLSPAHPLRIVRELADAIAFLDHPDAAAAHETASSIAAASRGRSVLIGRLRAHLQLELISPVMEDCAMALGLAPRTMQRALARLGTSFSDELRRVRVSAAEELLELSDLKIESIAARVGFGTASRMSAVLRRELGATATLVREGARGKRRAPADEVAAPSTAL